MRVAFDASALGSGRGGDETYLRGLLRGLATVADGDHRFVLLTPTDADLPSPVEDHESFARRDIPRRGGLARLGGGVINRAVAAEQPAPDLLFAQTHAPLRALVPIVLLVADLSFVHHPEHYPATTRRRLDALIRYQTRRAAGIVTISEYSRRDLIATYGLDPATVHIAYSPIEPPRELDSAATEAAAAELAAVGVRAPFLLYLGNLHPRKNVPRLIEAFTQVRRMSPAAAEHQLVIAGARWWGEGPEEAAAAAAPAASVVLAGRVSDGAREWLLRHATALAYPSLFEGFGLPPLEAMARGTPALASTTTAIPEVCGDAALLVDPNDTDAIAGGLRRLVEDRSLREELMSRGRERVTRYRDERVGGQLLEALERSLPA